MESILAILAGSVLGAAAAWALLRVMLRHLRAQLNAAQEAEKARSQELAAARSDAELWRERLHAERLARARFETEAGRVVELEPQLHRLRAHAAAVDADRAALRAAAERVPGLERRIEALGEEVAGLKAGNAQLQARLHEQAQAHAEKLALLAQVRGEIEKDLKAIAVDALRANQGSFVQLANEMFEKHKSSADADLEARQKAVETLVAPLRETLGSYKQQIEELEKARAHAYGVLSTEIKGVVAAQNAVRTETSKLVNALRGAPKTRGRWGEQTLQNVLELSGLSAYCDFSTQESFAREGGTARPDVIIRLPGGRSIVVDAKTSLSAYLDAVDATDDSERERHLALHAAQLRTHVKALAGKPYRELTSTPDFVVMFVPGDNFYAAAAERDPSLFEDAAAQGVVIATPATLIALAKAVAFGWRQEKVAENAQRVHALGRELYRRMLRMAEHIARCGDALGRSVEHYNQFIGSLERSVMPQARRFSELEVEGTATEIPVLQRIDLQPRMLRGEPGLEEGSGSMEAA